MNDQTALPRCLLQIIPSLDAGGAERACLDIADAVHVQGGQALVVSTGGRMSAELASLGGELVTLPVASKNPLVMLVNVFRLVKLIRERKVDLVHARSRAPAWSTWLAAQLAGAPFVTTFHGLYSSENLFKRLYNSVMLRGVRVIAGSHFMAAHIRAAYNPLTDHICVIPRGVDTRRFDPSSVAPERVMALRREWKIPDGAQIVLLPARLTRWKGQLLFVEALTMLERRDVIGVLCGDAQGRDSYEQEIWALARHHQIAAQLRITGNVADMPAAYAAAYIALSASSDAEAFGRVPVEAMAMGCTIIAADHGGAAETLHPGGGGPAFGILFAPGDAAGLALALRQGLETPRGGGAQQVTAARAHVLAHYSTAAMCARTLALYREILAG
ncbi:MAG: glycosyltransferase family 4 protein [Alphaproteobacteria bacterium]